LLVCPVNVDDLNGTSSRTTQACSPVTSSARTTVKLDEADGLTHVGMEFDGTGDHPTTIESLGVTYTAVDDHFYVDFAVH
jgi:hypothetical protein